MRSDVLIGRGIVGAACEAAWRARRRDESKMETVKTTQTGCSEGEDEEEGETPDVGMISSKYEEIIN